MSGLATLLRKLAGENGIELDEDELTELGLSADESAEPPADLETTDLGGEAAGAVELFVSEPRTWLAAPPQTTEEGFWEPIIREGQWAVRPGAAGQKRRRPLKIVAGHSENQRKEIGLQDIVDTYEAQAIEHVTVPTSHENHVTQNTGFIRKLKIVDGTYKPKGTKTEKKVKVLMGLYDIKLPDIKEKMDLGAIASRSAGLLYDYVDTERGKTWPVVLEHVALTNKPWITGMTAFGRKLKNAVKSTVGLSLSDEQPREDDLLAADDALDSIELADVNAITWDKTDDPDWLRGQANCRLDEARAKKIAALPAQAQGSYVSYDYPPRYRCVKARPGLALISDGWGDGANYWTAPVTVVDGEVELDDNLENWTPTKQAYIADDSRTKGFEPGEEPLSDQERAAKAKREDDERRARARAAMTPLQLAQEDRRERANPGAKAPITTTSDDETTHPRGGEHMAGENGTLQLSDEAKRLIEAAEDRAKRAEETATKLGEDIKLLKGDRTVTQADRNIEQLKRDGFTEERGFAGVLVEVRELMLADDGGPAVQGEHFSTDGNTEGTLSLSDSIMHIFKAFERTEDGKLKVGTQLAQPTTKPGEELGDDGKPKDKEEEKEVDFSTMSDQEYRVHLARTHPENARAAGIDVTKVLAEDDAAKAAAKASQNGGGS